MSMENSKNEAVQKNVGRPLGRKNSSIRADRMEVIQKVAEKLITGMATASSSELAKAIWSETTQDKVALNAKSKTVRLALKNIFENPELAQVPQDALQAALKARVGQKKSQEDIEKEKAEKEAARRARLELQKKEWLSQPIRLMESRIKAMVKEALRIYLGEGVEQPAPLPNFNVKVASNTFTRESVLRVLELELKIQLHTALRYTWDGEIAWEFYQKAKELIKLKKKLFNAIGLSREETLALAHQVKQLRDEVEQAYEKMNAQKGWADPDLTAGQQLSSSDLKHNVIQFHTDQVEAFANEKLPAQVETSAETSKPWKDRPLVKPDENTYSYMRDLGNKIEKFDEDTVDFEIASILSKRLLKIAGLKKKKPRLLPKANEKSQVHYNSQLGKKQI